MLRRARPVKTTCAPPRSVQLPLSNSPSNADVLGATCLYLLCAPASRPLCSGLPCSALCQGLARLLTLRAAAHSQGACRLIVIVK